VHALTLTDVVVTVTTLALLLALAVNAHKQHGTLDPRASGRFVADQERRGTLASGGGVFVRRA
jgi:hypothetical protein